MKVKPVVEKLNGLYSQGFNEASIAISFFISEKETVNK
jgi:hypothetical protein